LLNENIKTNKQGSFAHKFKNKTASEVYADAKTNALFREMEQEYPVVWKQQNTNFIVVSDIDDTILISKSKRFWSKLRLLLFRSAKGRKAVTSTQQAFDYLGTSHFQFAYVSGSEANLFHLISSFFLLNKIPIGPLFLKPFTAWKELFNNPNRANYKLRQFEKIMDFYVRQQLILFGDDSQQDYAVFKKLVQYYPSRIRAIYIRKSGLSKQLNHLSATSSLSKSKIPVYYYENFQSIQESLLTLKHEATAHH